MHKDNSAPVSVIDCTLEWPRYSNRFDKLIGHVEKYKAMKQEFPEDPETVVITGSTTGVYEDEEWIEALVEKTREYIENDEPVLGLCFGHQIIAKAMDTEVVQMNDYEIGYRGIEFHESKIFKGLDEEEFPFSTHQDRIVEVPEGFRKIAETDVCVQGIEHREKPVFGVQFHPELTPDVAEKAIRTKDIEEVRKKKLLEEVNDENFNRARRVLRIFENFLDVAEENGARGPDRHQMKRLNTEIA
ncbi:MAG: type 1 glutamine amidotransferase [Candidatus Nanosalina sp.]